MTNASEDVTRLLVQWSGGEREALDRLVPFIYDELNLIAELQFRRERADNTLQPPVQVNVVYPRMVDPSGVRDNWCFSGDRKTEWAPARAWLFRELR